MYGIPFNASFVIYESTIKYGTRQNPKMNLITD